MYPVAVWNAWNPWNAWKEAEINVAKRQTQVIVPDWIVIAILTLDAGLARSGSMKLQQSNQEAIQQVAPFEA